MHGKQGQAGTCSDDVRGRIEHACWNDPLTHYTAMSSHTRVPHGLGGAETPPALLGALGDGVSEALEQEAEAVPALNPAFGGAVTLASCFFFPWAGCDNETVSENGKGPHLTFDSPYSGILNCDVN